MREESTERKETEGLFLFWQLNPHLEMEKRIKQVTDEERKVREFQFRLDLHGVNEKKIGHNADHHYFSHRILIVELKSKIKLHFARKCA